MKRSSSHIAISLFMFLAALVPTDSVGQTGSDLTPVAEGGSNPEGEGVQASHLRCKDGRLECVFGVPIPPDDLRVSYVFTPRSGHWDLALNGEMNSVPVIGQSSVTIGPYGVEFFPALSSFGPQEAHGPYAADHFKLLEQIGATSLAELLSVPGIQSLTIDRATTVRRMRTTSPGWASLRQQNAFSDGLWLLEPLTLPDGGTLEVGTFLTGPEIDALLLTLIEGRGSSDKDDYNWRDLEILIKIQLKVEAGASTGAIPGGDMTAGLEIEVTVQGRLGDLIDLRRTLKKTLEDHASELLEDERQAIQEILRQISISRFVDFLPLPWWLRELLKLVLP